ncbi:MAG: hypothetical protein IAG10_07875 [Planctomycetaceae bacterium]|nr:hypothetical protein [Planctomycetaceae bacterium]
MSSDTTRHDLLTALAELGELYPDWRLGQTMANLAMAAGRAESNAVWDLEDDEALSAARRLIERRAARQTPAPQEALASAT